MAAVREAVTAGTLAGAERIRGRSDGIDLLRAVFSLWVVLNHLVPWARRAQGPDAVPGWLYFFTDTIVDRLTQSSNELHPAVLGFIVLSGYCIHRNGIRDSGDSLRSFSIRRAFRILPVFWLASLLPIATIAVVAARAPAIYAAFYGNGNEIIASCMAIKMSTLPGLVPFFHECSSQGNGPLLTVMVEIQLYVFYALFCAAFMWRGREKTIWGICAAAWLVGFTISVVLAIDDSDAHRFFYNWWQNSAVWSFLPFWWLGAACVDRRFAAMLLKRFWLLTILLVALSLALVAIWAITRTSYGATPLAMIRQLVLALWFAVVIVRIDGYSLGRLNPLPFIGRAGYSLYAFHAPLLVCLLALGLPWPLVLVSVMVLGIALYYLVERPGMTIGAALAGPRSR